MPSDRTVNRLMAAIALACLVSLAQFHVRTIVASSIEYDDAHNANVAKNLALGFGYSTSYHEFVPFNPQASTGPVILIPAAAFVRLFGNQYWVPTMTIIVCIWATLFLVLFLLRSYLTRREWFAAAALIAFGLMLYNTYEIGLLGDVPAAFLACASILVLCRPHQGWRSVAGAGLLLGLAMQAKLFTGLVLPSALFYLLASADARSEFSRRIRECLAFVAGAAVPFAAWEVWQFAAMGFSWHDWAGLKARQYAFIELWSGLGGVRQSTGLGSMLPGRLSQHAAALVDHFNGLPSLILFPAALALAVGAIAVIPSKDPRSRDLRRMTLVMLAAAATHLVWWCTLDSDGWYRHLLPGVIYFITTAAVAVVAVFRVSRMVGAIATFLLLLSWMPQFENLKVVFNGEFRPQARLRALLAARDEMVKLQANPDFLFVGYAWWVPRDLEYLLPTVGNFKDVLRLQPDEVKGRKIVLVRNEFFNWEQSAEERAFQIACDQHTLFRRDPFVISVCPSLPGDTH